MHNAQKFIAVAALLLTASLTGCATKFPSPEHKPYTGDGDSATTLFAETFNAHGGQHLSNLHNVNVSLTGRWKQLIRRIQPLVSDYTFRVDSQERLLPSARIYSSLYSGPAGNKKVMRTPDSIYVAYNDNQSSEPAVLSSTALTADAFHLFLLGPLALQAWQDDFTRLTDIASDGTNYQRLHLNRKPGFGYSDEDQVVLWIDEKTKLTARVQITLEGHETTKRAHVEVAYLDYVEVAPFVFPSDFFEKVKAPIAIDAHAWHLTGIDINRDYTLDDLQGIGFSGAASAPATPLVGLTRESLD